MSLIRSNPLHLSAAFSVPASSCQVNSDSSLMNEHHYSVQELATAWNLSDDTIRRMFENEPDVQVIERCGRTSKRRFRTLRIPESVAQRVYTRQKQSA
jgi:hypothetical protein